MQNKLFVFALLAYALAGCVQKTYRKTVVYRLHTAGVTNAQQVSIRGGDKPLSWDTGTDLRPIAKDSVYEIAVTYLTGYKFTEVKFTLNGEFELQDQPNRRVVFSEKDTTFYDATFNVKP